VISRLKHLIVLIRQDVLVLASHVDERAKLISSGRDECFRSELSTALFTHVAQLRTHYPVNHSCAQDERPHPRKQFSSTHDSSTNSTSSSRTKANALAFASRGLTPITRVSSVRHVVRWELVMVTTLCVRPWTARRIEHSGEYCTTGG
jgi:hypothetical protein